MITEYPQFFTATILEWKMLLRPQKYKQIVIESLRFLVEDKRIKLLAFVVMDNHIHLIWQMMDEMNEADVKRDFLKYTAQRIKQDLRRHHLKVLALFLVNARDRRYQFWERNALSIELRTEKIFLQKLKYIHENPVRAGMCACAEEYPYSSAKFYERQIDDFGFITHYRS